ncbi:hypothetical protein O6H91_09G078400 [Diphasiastrum complanatum]|nr:hypothetical protein O6H91_09G078400 [Diphasiastrum complanatum]
MGLESLPGIELARDGYVHLQSDSSDDTQESAHVKKGSGFSSARKFKEDCYSMEGSSDGHIAKENNESVLQVTATNAEKQIISENRNRHADLPRQKNMHPSTTFDNSTLLIFSKLLSSWDADSDHDQPLVSYFERPNQIRNPNFEGVAKGPDQRFDGKQSGSACLAAGKEDWSPNLECLEYQLQSAGPESNGNNEIQWEKADCEISIAEPNLCEISIAEPNLSADKENQQEDISEDEEGSEQRRDPRSSTESRHCNVESTASSNRVIWSRDKRKVESSKTKSTRRCYNKKLELDAQEEYRPLDFLKDRNAGEKKRRGFDPQLSGFPSVNGATGNADMEVKAISALPYKFHSRNADTENQNIAQTSATTTNMLQKEVHPPKILQKKAVFSHISKDSYVQMEIVNKGAPRTLNLMHSELPESLRRAKDMGIKPRQQPSLSAKRLQFLATVEKKETLIVQDLRLTQRTAIIQKNSRPSKSADVPFKRSAKPSSNPEHLTQSSTTVFLRDKQNLVSHKEVENRTKKDHNKILKQPKLKQNLILKRTVHRGMITSKGNVHNHNVPPQIGAKGNLLHNNSSIYKPNSNSDLTDKHFKSDNSLDSQSHTTPRKMKRMEHEPNMENPVCNLRLHTSSGKLEVEAAMRDDLIITGQSKTSSQFASEINGSKTVFHSCRSRASSEECDCAHDDKHTVDGGAQNEGSKGLSSKALNLCGKTEGDWWEDACDNSLPWDNFRLTVNEGFGNPPSKARQQRMSVDQADICETMSDSTYTEDSEHPSPVSVIYSPFQEGMLSRLRQDFQEKLHDTQMKMLQSSSTLSTSELLRQDHSSELDAIQNEQITEGNSATFETSCCPIFFIGPAENAEMDDNFDIECYVKRVLIASGFQLENKTCTEDVTCPLRLGDWKYGSLGTHQRLLLHCVNEALDLSLSQSVACHGQMKQSHVKSTLTGEHIFDEVCNHMSGWQKLSLQAADSIVDIEVSGADKAWRNLRQELADITRITECMVFSDVIDELLLDLMVLKE